MVSATESFCSGNQPFGFFPSKMRQKVAPRWAFPLDLALAGITIFSLWGIALQWTGAGGRTKLVALSLRVFVSRNGWLWVTATTGAGASHCQLSAPGLRLRMDGCAGTCIVLGSSAPLAGGAVQVG